MSDSRDHDQRRADLEWLYGGRKPETEQTKIWTEAEEAELQRRAQLRREAAARPWTNQDKSASVTPTQTPQGIYRPEQAGTAQTPPQFPYGHPPNQTQYRQQTSWPAQTQYSQSAPYSQQRQNSQQHPQLAQPQYQQQTQYGQQVNQRPPQHHPQPRQAVPPTYPLSGRQPTRNYPDQSGANQGGAPPTLAAVRGRRRFRWRRLLWLIPILLMAWIVYLVAVPILFLSKAERIADDPGGSRPAEQPGTTFLLVGTDKREGAQADELGQRADTIMLLYQPTFGPAVLVSLPRDSYVEIPGHDPNKINAAYAFGGPKLLIQTIETKTGLRIDGYAELNFSRFRDLVDAVGGVDICVDKDYNDKDSKLNVKAGCQLMNGETALAYVRMRKADPLGDVGRMARQREFLKALIKKVATPGTVMNPVSYYQTNEAFFNVLTLGESTSLGDLIGAARAFYSVSGGKGTSLSVPIADADGHKDGMSVVLWDDDRASDLFGKLAKGETDGMEEFK